jgi:hypothetical protein
MRIWTQRNSRFRPGSVGIVAEDAEDAEGNKTIADFRLSIADCRLPIERPHLLASDKRGTANGPVFLLLYLCVLCVLCDKSSGCDNEGLD